MTLLRGLLHDLATFAWPLRCPLCERLGEAFGSFCQSCRAAMPLLDPSERAWLIPGDIPVWAACRYEPPLRDLIVRWKYGGRRAIAPGLTALMVARLPVQAELGRPDVVVPVPMDRGRLRRRGFNQAAELALPIASHLGRPYRPGVIRRKGGGPRQARSGRQARLRNVEGVFRADGVRGMAILLVDDVVTTGATLTSAAACLVGAGARRVSACCLARTLA